MKSTVGYTSFPNLFDTVKSKQGTPATLQNRWPVDLSRQLLVLAWARLLHAYTGAANPVFALQQGSVQVDLVQGSWISVEVEDCRQNHHPHTSLILEDPASHNRNILADRLPHLPSPPRSSRALELRYHPKSGLVSLSSSHHVPTAFLPQILSQLQHFVVQQAGPDHVAISPTTPLPSVANPHKRRLLGPALLHHLIRDPSSTAIAIDFLSANKKRVQISYQNLERVSNRLASRLHSTLYGLHTSPTTEKVVPVLIAQSPQLYIAQVAILKCGASFCPLSLDIPPDRLAFILKDVGAQVLVTTEESRQRFTASELCLEILPSEVDEFDELQLYEGCLDRAAQEVNPDSLAYVMYTSGSTGLPKGVGISHRAVSQALLAHDEHVPTFCRFLQFAAPTFDVSIFEIFFTFYRGATLICCHRESMLSDLAGTMRQLSVDAAELTPTVTGTLLRSWAAVPSLKLLLTIGEVLPQSVIENFASPIDSDRSLLPVYGPTEASIHCTIQPKISHQAKAGTIGRPLSTVSALVISEDRNHEIQILPLGHLGELAVAGQLARGYVNCPEQTKAAFVDLPGYGLTYRTGDRVRMLPSGNLDCLGRIADGQVKIRGQRVELGEIEEVACRADCARLVVAIIIDNNVVIFCLSGEDVSFSAARAAIKEQCRAWLPSFMQPTDIVLFTQDPLRLPSGKIDKRALEACYRNDRFQLTSADNAVTNETELFIQKAIRNEIGIEMGRDEDLRSRGLDSLRAIRLASRLSANYAQVSATDILSAKTIVDLSKRLEKDRAPRSLAMQSTSHTSNSFQAWRENPPIELESSRQSDLEEMLPCSQLQCAMLSESDLSNHSNFNRIDIKLAKSVSPMNFVQAFSRLTQLNNILRSGFVCTDDPFFPYVRIVWKSLDLTQQLLQDCDLSLQARPPLTEDNPTLLRPLRLEIISQRDFTVATIYIHHALYDGWSWDLIMADLSSLIAGREPVSRPQFHDFVQFESNFLTGGETKVVHEYWMEHLSNVSPTTLPLLTTKDCRHEISVYRKVVTTNLASLPQELCISRHSIPSAAFGTLLHLYCGSADVVFGSVSSGRTLSLPRIEDIIGPCISTLPIRINFDHLHTVRDLVLHTDRLHHDFLFFGQLPLRDIKKVVGVPGDQPLFDALFVWQEGLNTGREIESPLSVIDETDALRFPLVLEMEPSSTGIKLKCTHDKSILPTEQIRLLLNQFEAILEFYSKFPNAPWKEAVSGVHLEDLSIANPNFSTIDPLPELTMTVDHLARTDPRRVAIEFVDDFDPVNSTAETTQLTYRELSEKSTALSLFLWSKSLMADEMVCLLMTKSIPLYISILAVLKAGAAYVVIDPQAPTERTHRILSTIRCRHCLTNSRFEGHNVLGRVNNVIFYDKVEAAVLPKVTIPTMDGKRLAYCVFTSGSTGAPKGVLISRSNIISNIVVLSRLYPTVAEGSLLQACSPAFDVSVFEILYTWHMGMRLCAASNDVLFRDLGCFIRRFNITHLSLTPTVAALLKPSNVPQVEMLVTAGEAVTAKVFREWCSKGLYQGYGPSETTNICSIHTKVSPYDHQNNVGRPLSNTSMFIFGDDASRPLPKGALGEIWIGGEQVGRGYLDDEEMTMGKFLDHPKYGRLYRSGDLGRMLFNGETLFHGRQDDQVKLRGQRIKLGEIEHALLQMPVVSDSVCLLAEAPEPRISRLVAFWCSKPSSEAATPTKHVKKIFEHLQAQLPSYMVPEYVVYIDSLPVTSQGKTDRKTLQQLFLSTEPAALEGFSRGDDTRESRELHDPIEVEVAGIIAEITRTPISKICRDTSFYALGIDSITSITLARKLRSLGLGQVDVSMILRHASIAKLLPALSSTSRDPAFVHRNTSSWQQVFGEMWIDKVRSNFAQRGRQVQKILPCTPLQETMISQAESQGTNSYHNRLTFSVGGNLQQLHAAWETCVAAHEILRTAFLVTEVPDCPYAQVVLSHYEPVWRFGDDGAVAGMEEEGAMAPPYSFTVDENSTIQRTKLILQIHHALYDGQAISLLLHDVEEAYRGTLPVRTVSSTEPYLQYMFSLDHQDTAQFWQIYMGDFIPCLMPEERKSSSGSDEQDYRLALTLPLKAAQDSAKQYSVSLLSLLQLNWARLLLHYSGKEDVCFGNVYSGRNLPVPDVENVVGPCFNTLPVRVQFSRADTNRQIAKRIHDHNIAAIPYQPSSLRRLQSDRGVTRLFDTLLLLQAEAIELDPSVWTLDEDVGEMGLPLIVEIVPASKKDELGLLLHSTKRFLSRHKLKAVAEDFDRLLQHTVQYLNAEATSFPSLGSNKPLTLVSVHPLANTSEDVDSSKILYKETWTEREEEVLGVLRKLSEREDFRLTRDTTIFHLGFDSISATQIAAELRRQGYELTGGDVMEAATVPQIALLCRERKASLPDTNEQFEFGGFSGEHLTSVCSRLSLDCCAVAEIRPCTPFQSGILADFSRSHGKDYLSRIDYELANDIDIKRLRESWKTIFSRHDMLRTGFVEIDGTQGPFAMILYHPESHSLPWTEAGSIENSSMAEHGQLLLKSLYEPPWRICISKKGSVKVMRLTMLHALFDATALDLVLDEVAISYNGGELREVVSIKPCLARILLSASSSLPDDSPVPSASAALCPTKFPNLHPHQPDGSTFLQTEIGCSRSLSELQTACQEAGTTLQVAGQCAWARLLSIYTGEPINSFGVVLTGRSSGRGEDSIVFPCINTVPVSFSVHSSNRALLTRSSKCMAQLMKNPFAPPTSKARSGFRGDIFDSIFVLQKSPSSVVSAPWKVVDEISRVNYLLSMELMTDSDDKLRFRLAFQTQVLPSQQAELLVKQFDSILLDTLDNLDGEASQYAVDNALVSTVLPETWEIKTDVKTLHQFVDINAQQVPNRVAFEFATKIERGLAKMTAWTYAELDAKSNTIAHLLQKNGAVVGDLIGICFEKCPEASFTILGVLKAGCGYIALDPGAPEARKKFILEDSKVQILCTTEQTADLCALQDGPMILHIDQMLLGDTLSTDAVQLPRGVVAEDICYCLYTSGTTGTPKGCLITHGNAVQFVLAFQRLFAGHWDSESRFLQFAAYHFDVSVMEQFWSWSIGICVTSAPRDLLLEDLPSAIQALRITHLDLTPSLARLLSPEECPSLCRGAFITGGEQLRQEIIDVWADQGILYNGYGPSEVTIGCTMYPRVPRSVKPSNIGFAYENAGLHVLDPQTRQPVLKGGIGELCVSGPLVGKGYLNRPSLTAEKFEFLSRLGLRVYHTGDLVRLLHDDSVCFVGRVDDQVKLRGQRLEVGEINHVVRQTSAAIKDVATVVIRQVKGSKESNDQLVTFITCSDGCARSSEFTIDVAADCVALIPLARRACITALAAYMVPAHIVPVTSIPLSANNKVDVKLLRMLFQGLSFDELQRLSATPASEHAINPLVMEKVVAAVSKVTGLPIDDINASSRLFELGLDSISVISLSRVLKPLGFPAANPSTIMKNPMVGDLSRTLTHPAEVLDSAETATQNARSNVAVFDKEHRAAIREMMGVNDAHIEGIAPCAPLQEGMISRKLNGDDMMYSPNFTFALRFSPDLVRLRAAWESVAERNQILRTSFFPTSDGYAQVVLRDLPTWSIRVEHSSFEDDQSVKNSVQHGLEHWVKQKQSLGGELWAVTLYVTPRKTWMSLNIFHGLYDGNSLALLLEEVACAYQGVPFPTPKPMYHEILPLGPLRTCAGAQGFWRRALPRVTLLNLPRLHGGDGPRVVSSTINFFAATQTLQSQLNVTEAAMGQACWLMAVAKVLGILPAIGILVSGRALDIDGVENVIGPLFNTIPCQMEITASSTIADLVTACHHFNAEAMPYQHSALSKISKWLGRRASEPVFDCLFVFQKATHDFPESRKLWQVVDSTSLPHYPLAIEIEQTLDREMRFTIVAQGEYISGVQIETLSTTLQESFQRLLHDPYQHVGFSDTVQSPNAEGKNIDESRGKTDQTETSTESDGITRHQPFQWNAITKLIRLEIARLAVCDTEDVRPETSIFELGLDSIDAIKLCARLKAEDIAITVSAILRAGSIAKMVAVVSATKHAPNGNVHHDSLEEVTKNLKMYLVNQGVDVQNYDRILPVTPLQEAMLAKYEQYYGQDVLKICDDVDIQLLKRACATVVSTHDILRTRFVELDDLSLDYTFAQLVCKDSHCEIIDTVLDNENQIQNLLIREREEYLSRGIFQPPLRLTFFNTGHENFLVVGLPHAVYDGWSINLLHQDVTRCYQGLHCRRPNYVPILEEIRGAVSENSQSFWQKILGDLQPKTFPPLQHRGSSANSIERCEIVSKVALEKAKAFGQFHGVTLQSLGLACWALTLAHHLRSVDVCFGLVLAGRNTEDADKMMFPTMNTIPFRAVLEGNKLVVVKSLHRLSISISEYQHFPLRQAASLVDGHPIRLFDTLFIYQKRPREASHMERLYKSTNTFSAPEYPVNIELEVLDDQLIWRSACDTDICGEGGSEMLLRRIDGILHSIITAPEEPIFALSSDGWTVCGLPPFSDWIRPTPAAKQSASSQGEEKTQLQPYEEILVQILAETAHVDRKQVGRSTSLFHLGLDSISAIKVSSALRKQSVRLPVGEIMRAPTVGEMAKAATPLVTPRSTQPTIEAQTCTDVLDQEELRGTLERAGIQKAQIESIVPCTAGQRFFLGMWQASGSRLFYPDFHFTVRGPSVGRETIDEAWKRLVQAVPMLRTTFLTMSSDGSHVVQAVLKSVENPIVWLTNQSAGSLGRGDAGLREVLPPVAMSAMQSETVVLLKLQIHHALYDGVSLPGMMHMFELLCNGCSSPSIYNVDFHRYVKHSQVGATAREQRREFWTSYVRGQCNNKPVGPSSFSGVRVENFQPKVLKDVEPIQKRLKKTNISFQALFLAAYAFAHAKIVASDDAFELIMGVYLANRSHDHNDLLRMLGPVVNVVPLRVPLQSKGSLLDSAAEIQRSLATISSITKSTVSLEELYEWTGLKMDLFVNFLRLPDIEQKSGSINNRVIVEEGEPEQLMDIAPATLEVTKSSPFATDLPHANNDLYRPSIDIEAAIRGGALDVGIFAPADRLDAEHSQRLLNELRDLLESYKT